MAQAKNLYQKLLLWDMGKINIFQMKFIVLCEQVSSQSLPVAFCLYLVVRFSKYLAGNTRTVPEIIILMGNIRISPSSTDLVRVPTRNCYERSGVQGNGPLR
ncbi:hypothetical protein GOODEAATRI_002582 [Goodea atripinnis]|uniref:Uncharacterized protein n=1 Tax=Goodea atripinnis TaxID=208336 RepID=A0ABV0NGY8_9TELE